MFAVLVEVEPQLQSLRCTILSEADTHTFTLAALYDDNSESPQSGPFLFTPVLKRDVNGDGMIDLKDVIIGLQVLMNLIPNEPVKIFHGSILILKFFFQYLQSPIDFLSNVFHR